MEKKGQKREDALRWKSRFARVPKKTGSSQKRAQGTASEAAEYGVPLGMTFAERWGGGLVAAVAAVTRLAHWLFVRARDPLYAHTLPETDMHTYWEWAKSIAAGDWLSRKQGVFYYGPLYPYWLAPWFRLFGPNFDLVHGLQAGIGVVAPLAVWDLARRLFGPREGLVAGLLVACAAPILFYEQLLLMEGLLVAIHALFLWSVGRGLLGEKRDAWKWAAISGLLAGLASLGRGNFQLVALLFVPTWFFTLGVVTERRDAPPAAGRPSVPSGGAQDATLSPSAAQRGYRWRALGAYALALGMVLGLSLARNGLIGGQWVLTTSNGPILLYIGNAPDSMGIFHYPDSFFALETKYGGDRGAVPWTRELVSAVAHSPGRFAQGLLRKAAIFLSSYEVADNANFYLLARFSPLVAWNPVGWSAIVAFGTLGLWLERQRWRSQLFLYVYAACFALSIIAVFVVGRYRLEFLLPMAIWAGPAVTRLFDALVLRRWSRVAALGAGAALLMLGLAPRWSPAIALNTPPGVRGVRPVRPNDYTLLARAYLEAKQVEKAKETLAEGFSVHPWDQSLAKNLAFVLEHQGQIAAAVDVLKRYLALAPGDVDMARELARLLVVAGRLQESEQLLQRILDVIPNDGQARQLLQHIRSQQTGSARTP